MKLPAFAAFIVIGMFLMACEQKAEKTAPQEEPRSEIKQPAINQGEAPGIYRVRLTAAKVEEYKLQTAPVRETPQEKVVPKSALMLDAAGAAWIFTNPEPQLFIRQSVTVKSMDGDLAILSEGPPVGTKVLTVGADKLLGLGSQ